MFLGDDAVRARAGVVAETSRRGVVAGGVRTGKVHQRPYFDYAMGDDWHPGGNLHRLVLATLNDEKPLSSRSTAGMASLTAPASEARTYFAVSAGRNVQVTGEVSATGTCAET